MHGHTDAPALYACPDEAGSLRNGDHAILSDLDAADNQAAASPSVEDLFDCLVNRRLPALTRILRAGATRLGLDESVALEALQEALTEAVRRIRSGEAAATPNRWQLLIGYARWRLIDAVRDSLPTMSIDPAARICLPPERLEQEELRAALGEAFDALPLRLRGVAIYCYQQHHTYQQAAEHFDLSEGTINRRLHKAREHLRASLLRRGIGEEFS